MRIYGFSLAPEDNEKLEELRREVQAMGFDISRSRVIHLLLQHGKIARLPVVQSEIGVLDETRHAQGETADVVAG
jgi:hypothetical protein